ncbi:hypothetical protein ACNKHX_07390 [Shigella flexneri]
MSQYTDRHTTALHQSRGSSPLKLDMAVTAMSKPLSLPLAKESTLSPITAQPDITVFTLISQVTHSLHQRTLST